MANDADYSGLQHPDSEYTEAQDPPSEYAKKNSMTPPAAKVPAPKSPGPNGEVTIPAVFNWEPEIDGRTEVDLLLHPKPNWSWHPTTADFTAITGVSLNPGPANFDALLAMIAEYKPLSIKRLNFFTHANRNVIGITGVARPDDIYFTSQVDEMQIAKYAASGLIIPWKGAEYTLDDVRARFAQDAIFVLYGCDAAFDPTTLLSALKDLLEVTVIGFKDRTVYCPPKQTDGSTNFVRQDEKLGVWKSGFDCDNDSTRDWRSLIGNPNAVKVAK